MCALRSVQYYTVLVLYRTVVLYYTALYYNILLNTVLYHGILNSTMIYSILYSTILWTLHYIIHARGDGQKNDVEVQLKCYFVFFRKSDWTETRRPSSNRPKDSSAREKSSSGTQANGWTSSRPRFRVPNWPLWTSSERHRQRQQRSNCVSRRQGRWFVGNE